jgi:hypothetical protein
MIKKGEIPKGQKRYYPRPKPEKEEVMKKTNTLKETLKDIAMFCLEVILRPVLKRIQVLPLRLF